MASLEQKNDKKKWQEKITNAITIPIVYLLVIVIFTFINHIMKPTPVAIDIIMIVFMIAYTAYVIYYEVVTRRSKIKELSGAFNRAMGSTFKNIGLPVIYVTEQGKMIWENKVSEEIYAKEYIPEIWTHINKQYVKKDGIAINIEKDSYIVFPSDIFLGGKKGKLLIFVNRTREKELEQILEDTRTTIGVVSIDNYEESFQGVEEIDKLNTLAQIDRELVKWITSFDGMITKVEKDKYVFAIEKKHVKSLQENSFVILEEINKISEDKLKVPTTISVGLSFEEENLYGRYKSSMTALDVALGRGGNQAVVKNNKKYDIYGEGAKALDKTNRVRARIISQALMDLIEKSEDVYIIGHKNTDIDCIGAAVGIYKICQHLGKQANIIIDSKYNNSTRMVIDKLQSEVDYEGVFLTKDDLKKLDFENSLLVVVDTHKESYLAATDIADKFDKKVIIDHHRRGPEFIEDSILTYHEVYASSTSELVTELLMYIEDIKLTSKEAEAIYAGILVDTKNFSFKTGVRTFEAAAYLRKVGLDISEVKHIFKSDFESYVAKAETVKNAEFIDGQIAISIAADSASEDMAIIAAQSADELLSITGILASFVLCQIDEVVMISGRSLGDINVQAILEKMGGGGHLTFAGAQLAGVTIEEAKEKLLKVVNEYLGKEEE